MSFIKNLESQAISCLQSAIDTQTKKAGVSGTESSSTSPTVESTTAKVIAMYQSLGINPEMLNIGFGFRLLGKKKQDEARATAKGKTVLTGFSGSYFRYGKAGKTSSFGSLVIRKDYLNGKVDYAPMAFYSVDPFTQDPDNADMYEKVTMTYNEIVVSEVEGEDDIVISHNLDVYRCWVLDPSVWVEAMGFATTTHLRMPSIGAGMTAKLNGIYNRMKAEESPGTLMVFLPYEANSFKAQADNFLKPVYGSEGERSYLELTINPAGIQLIKNTELPKVAKFNWGADDELKAAHAQAMLRNKEAMGQAPKTVNRACMADVNVKFGAAYPHKDIIKSFVNGYSKPEALTSLLTEMHEAAKACIASGVRTGIFSSTAHLDAIVEATSPSAIADILSGKAKTLGTSVVGSKTLKDIKQANEVAEELLREATKVFSDSDDSIVDC